jgi:hypothetical protein
MIMISACAAGSLGKMLHHLREQAKGGVAVFFLQCMNPELAHRYIRRDLEVTSAFRAKRKCADAPLRRTTMQMTQRRTTSALAIRRLWVVKQM